MDEEEIVLGAQAIAAAGRLLGAGTLFWLAVFVAAQFDLLPWHPHSPGGWTLVAVGGILGGGLLMKYGARIGALITDPLRGRTSFSAAVWGYGLFGSVIYSALGLFVGPGGTSALRIYSIGGFLYSLYSTVAVYQCARNARSRFVAVLARVSAVLFVVLILVAAYWYATGAFDDLLSSVEAQIG